MKKFLLLAMVACTGLVGVLAQDAVIRIEGGQRPAMAIPDLRGSGDAQGLMAAFNETLWGDVQGAGLFRMVPKTSYPASIPQQPSDFRTPPPVVETPRGRRGAMVTPQTGGGLWMSDWSGPPVSANYLAFGYSAVQNGVFVLRGWLFDLSRDVPAKAQVLGKNYLGSADQAGARKIAHEFAADIIAAFGGKSVLGSHIYYVHSASVNGPKEIWVMDPDGKNQRQITRFNSISIDPAVSPDGTKLAFSGYARGQPAIFVFSVDPLRDLHFYNQRTSVNATPEFTPDGRQLIYASAPGDRCCRIYLANLDGSGFRPITSSSFIDVEPKVNPKTGSEVVFVSGRSGPQQIYRMNIDGGDIERLTPGEGEAGNPSWNPDGQFLAYAWTRGYAAGAWNIFTMNVASRQYTQLTHGEGRNEHPSWAPDGVHMAFDSTRTGRYQIYTMLANGTEVQQLTSQGINDRPAWGR